MLALGVCACLPAAAQNTEKKPLSRVAQETSAQDAAPAVERNSAGDSSVSAPSVDIIPEPQAAPAPALTPDLGKIKFDLYDIPDQKLKEEMWHFSGLPGLPEEGSYQILLLSDSTPSAYLLRAGTQVGRVSDTAMPQLRQRIRTGALSHGGGASFWRNFWNPADPLQPFLWQTGLSFDVRHAATGARRSSPQFEEHYNVLFAQRPVPWVSMEVGGHFSRYGGGLTRNLKNPYGSTAGLNFWDSDFRPWWHASVGIPGVKWEVSLSNRLFPEYYWLDPHAGEGSYKAGRSRLGDPVDEDDTVNVFQDGALMREWSQEGDPTPSNSNFAQALHLKIGNIRYSAYMDPDVYRSTIHRVFFDELSAPFGQWGFGLVTARGSAHTLLRLDLLPWRVGFGAPVERAYFRIFFLRFDIAYRDLQTFHVGVATSVLLDSPAFRPGDTR